MHTTTTTKEDPMDIHDAMATQIAAWEHLERAETEVRVAAIRLDSLVPGAPLRHGVEASDRYRRALAARDEARTAYDAAQDIECPDPFVAEGDRAMTTITERTKLITELVDIREELEGLQERFYLAMQDVRRAPGGDWLYQRVDAYPGVRLDRDMGGGQSATDWIDEVGAFLEERDTDVAP